MNSSQFGCFAEYMFAVEAIKNDLLVSFPIDDLIYAVFVVFHVFQFPQGTKDPQNKIGDERCAQVDPDPFLFGPFFAIWRDDFGTIPET